MAGERRWSTAAAAAGWLRVAAVVVAAASAASSAAGEGVGRQTVPAMYVFGDSLVDVGNNDFLPPPAPRPPEPPCGIDLPPEAAAADGGGGGRFTNGFNLADVIGKHQLRKLFFFCLYSIFEKEKENHLFEPQKI
jgi:hypothetical protein